MGQLSKIIPSRRQLRILEEDCHVSRETLELLQIYVDLLVEWQGKTNLVSNSTLNDVWHRHILDSIQYRKIMPQPTKWLDIGTGAGFPGLVIAILGKGTVDVQLVESNNRKCAFLRKVVRETGLSVKVETARIESVTKQFKDRQVVTARALASLETLFGLTENWIANGAVGLFSKGRDYLLEIENCRGVWEYDLIKYESQIEEDSVLLEIRNLKKTES